MGSFLAKCCPCLFGSAKEATVKMECKEKVTEQRVERLPEPRPEPRPERRPVMMSKSRSSQFSEEMIASLKSSALKNRVQHAATSPNSSTRTDPVINESNQMKL